MVLPSSVYECWGVKLDEYRTVSDRRTSSNVTGPCWGNPLGVRPTMNGAVPITSGPAAVRVSPRTPSGYTRHERAALSHVAAKWCQLPSVTGLKFDVPKMALFWNFA